MRCVLWDVSEAVSSPQEVQAIESEVRSMERNVSEIKALLSSPETLPSPREDSLKVGDTGDTQEVHMTYTGNTQEVHRTST